MIWWLFVEWTIFVFIYDGHGLHAIWTEYTHFKYIEYTTNISSFIIDLKIVCMGAKSKRNFLEHGRT